MNIPIQVETLAKENGFNSITLAKSTTEESIYSVSCTNDEGFELPIGLPHYIIVKKDSCTLVIDKDFHITDAL